MTLGGNGEFREDVFFSVEDFLLVIGTELFWTLITAFGGAFAGGLTTTGPGGEAGGVGTGGGSGAGPACGAAGGTDCSAGGGASLLVDDPEVGGVSDGVSLIKDEVPD